MNKLWVVGIGPGKREGLTIEAEQVLTEADCIVGYTAYVELVKAYLPEKNYIVTGMTKEIDRVKLALAHAKNGEKVAMVCSGDAAVYGLAGLAYELAEKEKVEVEVIAGVSAAFSGGAVLGAPMGHDFAVISLSDLLTPWEMIEKRLIGASLADFVICLYNPSGKRRADYLQKACDICLRYKAPETVCGLVRNIGRDGESARILSLSELRTAETDMFTTVFIGNSETKNIGGKMVTPRGYQKKYEPEMTGQRTAEAENADQETGEKETTDREMVILTNAGVNFDASDAILPDAAYLRNTEKHVPMTKYPVRVISVNELGLTADMIAYDIGAGTGSVTIEMAKKCKLGTVYAIEKKEEAVEILTQNISYFGIKNIKVIQGAAPEALENLPAPDCVFIGGSSGELKQIIDCVRQKNEKALFVVTAVTLETLSLLLTVSKEYADYADMRILQLAAAEVKTVGQYHMMNANNPVYIATFGGK